MTNETTDGGKSGDVSVAFTRCGLPRSLVRQAGVHARALPDYAGENRSGHRPAARVSVCQPMAASVLAQRLRTARPAALHV